MKWLSNHSLAIITQVELDNFFVYGQVAKEKLIEVSLQEYKLDAGVIAMVGIDNGEAPVNLDTIADSESVVIQDELSQMKDKISKFTDGVQGLLSGLTATVTVTKKQKQKSKPIIESDEGNKGVTFSVPIIKVMEDGDQRIAFGPVLIPLDEDEGDGQKETYDEEAVEFACHYWMESWQVMTEMHTEELEDKQFSILECYIAPVEFELNGHTIKKGTWLLMVRIVDDDIWQKIKDGELNAFSIGGVATATQLEVEE